MEDLEFLNEATGTTVLNSKYSDINNIERVKDIVTKFDSIYQKNIVTYSEWEDFKRDKENNISLFYYSLYNENINEELLSDIMDYYKLSFSKM